MVVQVEAAAPAVMEVQEILLVPIHLMVEQEY
jgi:hypothetical protein